MFALSTEVLLYGGHVSYCHLEEGGAPPIDELPPATANTNASDWLLVCALVAHQQGDGSGPTVTELAFNLSSRALSVAANISAALLTSPRVHSVSTQLAMRHTATPWVPFDIPAASGSTVLGATRPAFVAFFPSLDERSTYSMTRYLPRRVLGRDPATGALVAAAAATDLCPVPFADAPGLRWVGLALCLVAFATATACVAALRSCLARPFAACRPAFGDLAAHISASVEDPNDRAAASIVSPRAAGKGPSKGSTHVAATEMAVVTTPTSECHTGSALAVGASPTSGQPLKCASSSTADVAIVSAPTSSAATATTTPTPTPLPAAAEIPTPTAASTTTVAAATTTLSPCSAATHTTPHACSTASAALAAAPPLSVTLGSTASRPPQPAEAVAADSPVHSSISSTMPTPLAPLKQRWPTTFPSYLIFLAVAALVLCVAFCAHYLLLTAPHFATLPAAWFFSPFMRHYMRSATDLEYARGIALTVTGVLLWVFAFVAMYVLLVALLTRRAAEAAWLAAGRPQTVGTRFVGLRLGTADCAVIARLGSSHRRRTVAMLAAFLPVPVGVVIAILLPYALSALGPVLAHAPLLFRLLRPVIAAAVSTTANTIQRAIMRRPLVEGSLLHTRVSCMAQLVSVSSMVGVFTNGDVPPASVEADMLEFARSGAWNMLQFLLMREGMIWLGEAVHAVAVRYAARRPASAPTRKFCECPWRPWRRDWWRCACPRWRRGACGCLARATLWATVDLVDRRRVRARDDWAAAVEMSGFALIASAIAPVAALAWLPLAALAAASYALRCRAFERCARDRSEPLVALCFAVQLPVLGFLLACTLIVRTDLIMPRDNPADTAVIGDLLADATIPIVVIAIFLFITDAFVTPRLYRRCFVVTPALLRRARAAGLLTTDEAGAADAADCTCGRGVATEPGGLEVPLLEADDTAATRVHATPPADAAFTQVHGGTPSTGVDPVAVERYWTYVFCVSEFTLMLRRP